MQALRDFREVVDVQTIVVTGLALLATHLCNYYQFHAELPSGLIGIAIIFPIVFSINAAYRRREEVLRYFASIKAHAVAIQFAHRDWEGSDLAGGARGKELVMDLLGRIHDYFTEHKDADEPTRHAAVYGVFNRFSASHETLRESGVSNSEISRMNQYLRAIVIDFEKMRNLNLYQTPRSLRAYSQVFLNLFPILYAPYFAQICMDSYLVVGYAVAGMYSIVLVTLDNIQEDLENPFDKIGVDDVNLDVAGNFDKILEG